RPGVVKRQGKRDEKGDSVKNGKRRFFQKLQSIQERDFPFFRLWWSVRQKEGKNSEHQGKTRGQQQGTVIDRLAGLDKQTQGQPCQNPTDGAPYTDERKHFFRCL